MGGKSSTQVELFLPGVCQLCSRLEIFLKTLKCSSEHVDCIFDNRAEFFFAFFLKKV